MQRIHSILYEYYSCAALIGRCDEFHFIDEETEF